MPKQSDEIALPGFEGLVLPDTDRAGSQVFTDEKKYTGLTIRRDYPNTFKSVVRALFFYKLSVRTCCDLFQMNSQCVSAIRDMVIAEAGQNADAAFLINSRQRSQRDLVLTRIVEAIAEKLDDAEIVKKLSIGELTLYLDRLENAKPARNGTDTPSKSLKDEKPENKDYVDVYAFDTAINGLEGKKKSAEDVFVQEKDRKPSEKAFVPSNDPTETDGNRSTTNANSGVCSL